MFYYEFKPTTWYAKSSSEKFEKFIMYLDGRFHKRYRCFVWETGRCSDTSDLIAREFSPFYMTRLELIVKRKRCIIVIDVFRSVLSVEKKLPQRWLHGEPQNPGHKTRYYPYYIYSRLAMFNVNSVKLRFNFFPWCVFVNIISDCNSSPKGRFSLFIGIRNAF